MRHNLYARTYPGECAKIMEQNFSASYEPGTINNLYPSPKHPENLLRYFRDRLRD